MSDKGIMHQIIVAEENKNEMFMLKAGEGRKKKKKEKENNERFIQKISKMEWISFELKRDSSLGDNFVVVVVATMKDMTVFQSKA